MRGFAKQLTTLPESPMRLLASWFACCALFEILRPYYILYISGFVLLWVGVFVLLTAAQQLLPLPRLTDVSLAGGTLFYAFTLAACRYSNTDFTLLTLTLVATLLVLVPLLKRQDDRPLLPFTLTRRMSVWLVIGFGVLFFIILGTITCLRYLTFSSPNYDFGIFCNMFYNMKESGLPLVSCERNQILSHFAVHISPIYYLILPFYMLFPSPLTLQLAQTAVLASGLLPLYKLARHFKLSHVGVTLVCLLYTLYPAVSAGCFYDIHENCFLVPLLFWLFWCYETKRYGLLCVPASLILLVKEDAAVYLAFFAIYLLCSRRDIRRATPLLGAAAVYFACAIFLLQTFGTGAMFGRYTALFSVNKDTGGFLGTLLRDPVFFLTQIAQSSNVSKKLTWLLQLLLPFGLLLWTPRGKYSRLTLLLPLLLNLLTQYVYQFNINYQYSFGTLPFLFYLFLQNAADAPPRKCRGHLLYAVLAAGLLYVMLILAQFTHYTSAYLRKYDTYAQMEAILDTIPDDVSVIASTVLIPHLADRTEIYEDFYHAEPDTDYVVLDFRSPFNTQSEKYYEKCIAKGYTVVSETPNLITVLQSNQ